MPKQPTVKKLFLAVFITMGVLLLSGCNIKGITPLPYEERYQYIHQAREALHFETAGEIEKETYDTGDGVFTSSYLITEVKGEQAYTLLKDRLKTVSGPGCEETKNDYLIECFIGQVTVEIGEYSSEATYIKIKDRYSGREQS